MTNSAQEDINKLTNKERIRYLDLSNRELEGEMNLGDFKNLKKKKIMVSLHGRKAVSP